MVTKVLRQRLTARSTVLLARMDHGALGWAPWWVAAIVAAFALRIVTTPLTAAPGLAWTAGYALLALAPALTMIFAWGWFAEADRAAVPAPLWRSARWRDVPLAIARRHRLYGPSGLMVSLLAGLLLAIPLRAAEYWAALPALSASVPAWLQTLHLVLTADVVIFTSLYAMLFVAALKRSPRFPLLLMLVWAADLAMQLGIARTVAAQGDLPVAVAEALHRLLANNVVKVLVSVALWLPYLLLSRRVNVTYRRRVPA